MQKSQKIWLLIPMALFIFVEILFSFIPTFFVFIMGYGDFPSLAGVIFTDNFLESNPVVSSFFLVIEYLALVTLFIYNIRFNNIKIYKWIASIFLGIFLAILSFTAYLMYAISHISF